MITTKIDVSKSTITQSVIDELMSKGEVQLFSSEPLSEQEKLDEEQLSILNSQIPPNEFFKYSKYSKYSKYIGKGLRSQIQEYERDNIRGIEAWKKRAEYNIMYGTRVIMGSDPVTINQRDSIEVATIHSNYYDRDYQIQQQQIRRHLANQQRFKEDAEKLYNAVFAIGNNNNLQSE